MSYTRRNELRHSGDAVFKDEDDTFTKPFQSVGRPPVTDKSIKDEYVRNAPSVPHILLALSNIGLCLTFGLGHLRMSQ